MSVIVERFDVFASGFWLTLQLCLLSAIGAIVLGTVVAVLRIAPIPPLRALGTAYVTIFRNVPLTVVFFFMAFGLPALRSNADFLRIPVLDSLVVRLGTDLPYFRFAILALVMYTAAFVCEAIRSGVNAVPVGQAEAARSLGMTFGQNVRHIILPQAAGAAVVPLGSVIIAMIKNSALAGFFGVVGDLSQTSEQLTSAEGYALFPVSLGISAGYLLMTIPLGLLMDRLERARADAVTGSPASGGGAKDSVLYDVPGPRARRTIWIGSAAAGVLAVLGAYWLVYQPLQAAGQFTMKLWGPLLDPTNEVFSLVWRRISEGLRGTLLAAVLAIVISLVLGTLFATQRVQLAALRTHRFSTLGAPAALVARGSRRLLALASRIWVEVFRGLPVIITILVVSSLLPQWGVGDPLWYVVGGLVLYNMVVIAEILRSGMDGLPAGQREAAAATGLTSYQSIWLILLPQAFRTMLPALISQLVVILKDTSLGIITSYDELLNVAKRIIGELDNPIQVYVVVGLIFIAVNYSLSRLAQYVQRRLSASPNK